MNASAATTSLLSICLKIPVPVILGIATVFLATVVGLARNRLVDDRDGHRGHLMVGGDLVTASIALCGAEFIAKAIELSCRGRWQLADFRFTTETLVVTIVILIVFLFTVNHDRFGRKEGPAVSRTRVLWSNFWGVVATLSSVGITSSWTHIPVI